MSQAINPMQAESKINFLHDFRHFMHVLQLLQRLLVFDGAGLFSAMLQLQKYRIAVVKHFIIAI
jgi:hypothetical protein